MASRLQREIRNAYTEDGVLRSHWKAPVQGYCFLQWRLGVNLYRSGQSEEASAVLVRLCERLDEDPSLAKEQGLSEVSYLHQTLGQCAVQLFLIDGEHKHLEEAYQSYQSAVDHGQANLVAMFKLPSLLLEFGRLLEYFGSFEAAMEIYSQLLTKFPNFHGYFAALYRTAVVGRHLASLASSEEERKEAIDKCIDIFQFLLEALPSDIQAVHIVMLYVRTLEASADAGTRFRANNIYRSLHTLCAAQGIAMAGSVLDAKQWAGQADTWYQLGQHMETFGEYLIAKEAYAKYLELLRKSAKSGQDLSQCLRVDQCLALANNFAKYQNFPDAVRFAEMGLKIDHYNTDIRALLGKWNVNYQDNLSQETVAINRIKHIWKDRVWQTGYVNKLRKKMITEQEARLAVNRFDPIARESLSYYARDKYRARFLYEDICIVRVQRWFRKVKKQMVWLEVQRQHYNNKANELVQRLVEHYFSPALRLEVVELAKSKFIAKKHQIVVCSRSIIQENKSFNILFRALRIFYFKRRIAGRILVKRRAETALYVHGIILVQKHCKRYIQQIRYRRLIVVERKRHEAARVIQKFYRKRKMSLRYVVYALLYSEYRRKTKALKILKKRLPALLERLRKRRKDGFQALEKHTRRRNERFKRMESGTMKVAAAVRIQHFYHKCLFRYHLRLAIKQLRRRRNITHNTYYKSKLAAYLDHKEDYLYHNPGINKNSQAFLDLLGKEAVICDSSMQATDYMLLGLVLKHPQCAVHTLILHNVSIFKEDVERPQEGPDDLRFHSSAGSAASTPVHMLHSPMSSVSSISRSRSAGTPKMHPREPELVLPELSKVSLSPEDQSKVSFFESLTKSLSLKALYIIDGSYHRHIIQNVFRLVQIDNARVRELVIEDINRFSFDAPVLKQTTNNIPHFTPLHASFSKKSLNLLQDSLTPRKFKGLRVQIHQPRRPPISSAANLCLSTNLLLLDYFNYSIPGIRSICLHDCRLSDDNISLFAEALEVNTSLQTLYLSLNLLTDKGFVALFKSMLANKNSRLHLLDVSFNLLQCTDAALMELLASYRIDMHKHIVHANQTLTLDFSHNQIVKRFDVIGHAVQEHIVPQLSIVYESKESNAKRRTSIISMPPIKKKVRHHSQEVDPSMIQRYTNLGHYGSTAAAVPVARTLPVIRHSQSTVSSRPSSKGSEDLHLPQISSRGSSGSDRGGKGPRGRRMRRNSGELVKSISSVL